MICAVCDTELEDRYVLVEFVATRPPYEPRRWSFCPEHARVAAALLTEHIDLARHTQEAPNGS